ncbi:hypothetical protein D3C77_258630 [compost metagenome]
MPVQAVVVDVLVLVAQPGRLVVLVAFDFVRRGAVAPVEGDHQAAGFWRVGIAAIKIGVGIVEYALLFIVQLIQRKALYRCELGPIPPRF